ncbi:unnamed protein product [Mucor hiemalis]
MIKAFAVTTFLFSVIGMVYSVRSSFQCPTEVDARACSISIANHEGGVINNHLSITQPFDRIFVVFEGTCTSASEMVQKVNSCKACRVVTNYGGPNDNLVC